MKTFLNLIIFFSVISLTAFAQDDGQNSKKQKINDVVQSNFSNLLSQAKEKYAESMDAQQQLIWVLSNLWISIDETTELIDSTEQETLAYLTKFQQETLINFYKDQLKKINESTVKANEELTKQIEKIKAQIKNVRNDSEKKARRLRERTSKSFKNKFKELQLNLQKQQKELEKIKEKQVKELKKQMDSIQKQLKNIEKSAKNFKMPSVPKAPKVPKVR